ncbi:hypothetical protein V8C43DRAFT_273669 [Trichoderma afarasin]
MFPRGPLCGLLSLSRIHTCNLDTGVVTLYSNRPSSVVFAVGCDYLMCFSPAWGKMLEKTSGDRMHLDALGDDCILPVPVL